MIARRISAFLRNTVEGWNQFWFATEHGPQLTLFRIALALLLIFFEATRIPDLDLFYSDGGLAPLSVYREFMEVPYKLTLLSLFTTHAQILALHLLEIASLATLAMGFLPRLSALVALALHVSFMHRNIAINYGVDNISTFFLFYLTLADYRVRPPQGVRAMLGSVALRLIQIQICIVYVYAGLDKVRGSSWWTGDALWYALGNTQRCSWDFGWLAHFPVVIAALTYSTLIFETYFPLLVVSPRTRPWALWTGVFLHVGIAISMNLFVFTTLMMLAYLTFLKPETCEALLARFRKKHRTIQVPLAGAEENYV